jgi:hypothetical protein
MTPSPRRPRAAALGAMLATQAAAVLAAGLALYAPPCHGQAAPDPLASAWQAWRGTAVLRLDGLVATQGASVQQRVALAGLQVKLLPTLGEGSYGRLEFRATVPGEDARDAAGQTGRAWRWLEAYAGWQAGSLDLRLGQQIMAWGRADGLNPTDNLAPRNLRTRLPFDDDQRFGTLAARAAWALQAGTDLTLVYTPWFTPSRVALPSLPNPVHEQRPQRSAANSVWAAKLDRSDAGLDASLSLYHGPSLLPELRLLGVDERGPHLQTRYDRVTVFGADMARTFGRTALRTEAAWLRPRAADDGAPAVKKAQLYAVLGAERLLASGVNVNLQWWGRRVAGWTDPLATGTPAQAQVAQQNAIGDGQQARFSQGLTLRLNAKWLGDTLEADLLWVGNLTQHDQFARPALHYAWSDSTRLSAGGVLYRGPAASLFGRKRADSRAFVELRHAL